MQLIRNKFWETVNNNRDSNDRFVLRFQKLFINDELLVWNETKNERKQIFNNAPRETKRQQRRNTRNLKILNVNARSTANKVEDIDQIVMTHSPDVVVVTEAWLIPSSLGGKCTLRIMVMIVTTGQHAIGE